MRYYIIAGEASGDLHGSKLLREIKKRDSDAVFRFWGGDLMQEQAGKPVKHYRELAFMGFVEVVMNLRTILRNIDFCKKDILEFKPDAVILIDYPGFNMRIAQFTKQNGIRTIYYISPQIWAWKESRVEKIKRDVDRMLVILPFEKDFYRRHNFQVDFVGHPLLDSLEEVGTLEDKFEKPVVAILPGSRKQEISRMLPQMIAVREYFPDHEFVVAAAPSQPEEFYKKLLPEGVRIIKGNTYALLKSSRAALVTSGTATLETALLEVPEVVCYAANAISYQIAKKLIRVKYISLVNLIMDRAVVKELIQGDFNIQNLRHELSLLLHDDKKISELKSNYKELKEMLGGTGASAQAAELIVSDVKKYAEV